LTIWAINRVIDPESATQLERWVPTTDLPYLEKDFIEKVFRVLKTQEEVEPVRHRLEHRVRTYLLVCMLAYRLLSVLQWKLKEVSGHEDSWERADALLHALGRVERVEVTFGNETKTWYLNLTKAITDSLKDIGMNELLEEETRLVNSLEMQVAHFF
jgi:transposase